jgi:hypothetical protein
MNTFIGSPKSVKEEDNVCKYFNNKEILICKVLNYLSLKGNCAQTMCMITTRLFPNEW